MVKKNFRNLGKEAASRFITSEKEETTTDITNNFDLELQKEHNQEDKEVSIIKDTKTNSSKLWKDKFRTTTVLEDEVKNYLDIIVRLDGCSITTYLNNLVKADMQVRAEEYKVVEKMFNKNK